MDVFRIFFRCDPAMVDRLCELSITIAVQAEVCRQQAAELDRLRRAAKAHRRMKRKDSADIIAASINTREALRKTVGAA
jgi:hypothetical protein